MGNLFSDIPSELPEELVEVLLQSDGVRVERIVSQGHRSPDGFWYEQDEDELVVLLDGEAVVELEDEGARRSLKRGDWMLIPAGRRHRVAWTHQERHTIWLAVFTRASLR